MERNENAEKNKNQHIDDFYIRFKDKLEKGHSFPSDYTFKFIIPSDLNTMALIHAIFEKSNASFYSRDSKNSKYTSITIKTLVNDADDIIIYYRQVSSIKGIVML